MPAAGRLVIRSLMFRRALFVWRGRRLMLAWYRNRDILPMG